MPDALTEPRPDALPMTRPDTSFLRLPPADRRDTALACGMFFFVLCAYYVLRPVRDEMAVRAGAAQLSWLFSATFVTVLCAAPLFGWVAARVATRWLAPCVLLFFASHLLVFRFALDASPLAGIATSVFFVWISVFGLCTVSVFWSLVADRFPLAAAERLFGPIAVGGSAGAIAGPLLTSTLAAPLGVANLSLVSAALLGCATLCALALTRGWHAHPKSTDEPVHAALGGSAWEGFTLVARSPVLRLFCVYLVLHALLGTVLYFEQTRLMASAFGSPAERTAFFARVDLAVNVLTVATQLFGVGPIVQRFGVALALALLPALSAFGFTALAVAPTFAVLVVFGVARRAGEYAIARPAREMLFTVLPRNVKYKAKNFLDTAVFRGADAATSWIVEGARAIGLIGGAVALAAVPMALAGALVGWRLGRHPEILDAEAEARR